MRLRGTSGVRPTASKMLLHFIRLDLARRRGERARRLCHNLQSSMRSRGDVARRGEGDTRGSSEYFEWSALGTDCGVFAGGAGGEYGERVWHDGDLAGG